MTRLITVLASGLALVISGCGSQVDPNRPTVVKVSGTVTYKGQPVEGATVLFAPTVEPGFAATSITDRDGNYSLRTFNPNDGAVPGDYKVAVSKFDMSTANPDMEDDFAAELKNDASDVLVGPTSLLPKRYSEVATANLSAQVSESGENQFTWALTD